MTNRDRLISNALPVAVALLLAGWGLCTWSEYPTDTVGLGWYYFDRVVDLRFNSYFPLRLSWFSRLSLANFSLHFLQGILLLFIALSAGRLATQLPYGSDRKGSFACGVVAGVVGALFTYGSLTVLEGLAGWLLSTMVLYDRGTRGAVRGPLLALVAVSLLASTFGPYGVASLFVLLLLPKGEREANLRVIPLTIITIGVVTSVILTSHFHFPEYPPNARVLYERSTLSGLDPLVGVAPSVQITDRSGVRSYFSPIASALLAISLLLLWKDFRRGVAPLLRLVVALAIAVALDTNLVAEWISLCSPVYSFERLVPMGIALPLILMIVPVAVLLTVLLLGESFGALLVPMTVLLASLSFTAPIPSGSAPVRVLAAALSATPEGDELLPLFLSPSARVISSLTEGSTPSEIVAAVKFRLHLAAQLASTIFTKLPAHTQVWASSHAELVANLRDGDPRTRWFADRWVTKSSQYLTLEFPNVVSSAALYLVPGIYPSDFPRGLKVETKGECSPADSSTEAPSGDSLQPILPGLWRATPWQGALLTTASGLPYIGPEGEVKILIPSVKPFRCITIKQSEQSELFDWSVAEIKAWISAL